MNPLDHKYCGILSTRLEQYQIKQTNPYQANFRCYVCGDSEKKKSKKRGWLLDTDKGGWYYCHNCGHSSHIERFLKEHFPAVYNDYVADKLLEKISGDKLLTSSKKLVEPEKPLDKLTLKRPEYLKNVSPLQQIRKVSSLPPNHPVKRWVTKRMIPSNKHHRLYFAPKFNKWSNTIIPDGLDQRRDEARLVTPFIDQYGKLFGYSGRSFLPTSPLRYITMMINNTSPKIYGLDVVDFNRTYYVLEGQIDSLFVDNAIAMVGSSVSISGLEQPNNAVFVFDNEPRNKQIVAKMLRLAKKGYNVVVWPSYVRSGVDVNDLIVEDQKSMAEIETMLKIGTCKGLEAEIRINEWKRI